MTLGAAGRGGRVAMDHATGGEPGDPFADHLVADIVRLGLVAMGVFVIMVCARVACARVRHPDRADLRDRQPLALLSYALFATLPTVNGMANFGRPLDVPRTALYAAALATGVAAAFDRVAVRSWWGTWRADDDEEVA